jgi:hypothetical protein
MLCGTMMPRPLLIVSLLAALTVAGCADEEGSLRLALEATPDQLQLTVRGHGGQRVAIMAGQLWRGTDPLLPELAGLLILDQPPRELAAQKPAPGLPLELVIPAGALDGLPDPCALQAVVFAGGRSQTPAATSEVVLVHHDSGGLSQGGLFDGTLQADGGDFALHVALPLALLLVLAFLRWPGGKAVRLAGQVVLGLALLAVIVERVQSSGDDRRDVAYGYAPPPILWPGDWELGGDHLDRSLGPGFTELADACREALARGEAVEVWSRPRGFAFAQAIHLAAALDVPYKRYGKTARPRGLAVLFGVKAEGEGDVLLATPAGELRQMGAGR